MSWTKRMLRILLPAVLAFWQLNAVAATWYVNAVSGSDSNTCMSSFTPCKTIGHAISLAASGDTISVSPSVYAENVIIGSTLKIFGAGAKQTIIDGGGRGTVMAITNSAARVTISGLTIRNGRARAAGGGIKNVGTLMLSAVTVTGNTSYNVCSVIASCGSLGGGISNSGALTVNNSTISNNAAIPPSCNHGCSSLGGGIYNTGVLLLSNSTIAGNSAVYAGAIDNGSSTTASTLSINSSTIAANVTGRCCLGGIIGPFTTQNSIFANIYGNNTKGNCGTSAVVSKGYNLSSDSSCKLTGPGDLTNIDPMLQSLQYNGGPTETMALPSGSPAIDAGNPTGCTNGFGTVLKTDQRGAPRPDIEDTHGCDIGAYERQGD